MLAVALNLSYRRGNGKNLLIYLLKLFLYMSGLTWSCLFYLVDVSEGGVLRGTVQVNPTWTESGIKPCRQTDISL